MEENETNDDRETYNVVFACIQWSGPFGWEKPPREIRFEKLKASRGQVAVKIAMNRIGMVYTRWGIVAAVILVEHANQVFVLHQWEDDPDGILEPC